MRTWKLCIRPALLLALVLAANPGRVDAKVKDLQAYAPQLKAELEEAMKKAEAQPGSFVEKMRKYDELVEAVKDKFVAARKLEYTSERETTQTPNFEVERDHAGIGAPRRTSHNNRDVRAPEHMVFDSLDWKARSEIGDTKKDHSVSDGGKVVHLHIQARAQSHGSGRSMIKTDPVVTWKYEDPDLLAESDWLDLKGTLKY